MTKSKSLCKPPGRSGSRCMFVCECVYIDIHIHVCMYIISSDILLSSFLEKKSDLFSTIF